MFIGILLFIVILTISIVLALRSMADYREYPLSFKVGYTLYLISKPEMLTVDLLGELYKVMLQDKSILAFERLFKGQKRALLIFGPVPKLRQFSNELGLIELEEYSKKIEIDQLTSAQSPVLSWEVGTKHPSSRVCINNLLSYMPKINPNEEFWWQLVLQPYSVSPVLNLISKRYSDNSFKTGIRAVAKADNYQRVQELQTSLAKIGADKGLSPLPQQYSTVQMIKFYQERVLPQNFTLGLTPAEIIPLLS